MEYQSSKGKRQSQRKSLFVPLLYIVVGYDLLLFKILQMRVYQLERALEAERLSNLELQKKIQEPRDIVIESADPSEAH